MGLERQHKLRFAVFRLSKFVLANLVYFHVFFRNLILVQAIVQVIEAAILIKMQVVS